MIPPAAFLYIAERLDLIQEIDAWVVRHAIQLLAADKGPGGELPLHVNLSELSLGEAMLLGRTPRRFGERLAELGCHLALDDFGAGFGSFYYLKHLPFDFLKIDGEFIRNCRASKTDRLMIEAVVGIARGLGKHTITECVGDQETVGLLTRLGVDYGQGFHHGRPAEIAECVPARTDL